MKTKTEKILIVLNILAYLGMVAYAMVCGSQLMSFLISFKNPDVAKHFYAVNQNIYNLRQYSIGFFINAMCIVIILGAIKVYIWILAIQLLSKLNLKNPFSTEVAKKIERIALLLLVIWITGVLGNIYFQWLSKTTNAISINTGVKDEFLFMAGIVYIISQIFKRGIEIQEENLLTV